MFALISKDTKLRRKYCFQKILGQYTQYFDIDRHNSVMFVIQYNFNSFCG